MIKVSDYIFKFLREKGVEQCFVVSGGASAHLLDSLKNSGLKYICNTHEQSCAMAADAYARIAKKPALVLVTNGPGSTNALTGVLGAYQDSIPVFILSGQVPDSQSLYFCGENIKLRQVGVQECDIAKLATPITNYYKHISSEKEIPIELETAFAKCISNRMGPVWLDIPIDIQSKQINEESVPLKEDFEAFAQPDYSQLLTLINSSQKPLFVIGNGVHLSNTESVLLSLLEKSQIPAVFTWNAKDIIDHKNELFVGSFGIFGDRAGNFAVQSSDLLIVLGSRLSIPNVGYNSALFAPNAKKIMVDVDLNEIKKHTLNIDLCIKQDLRNFLPGFLDYVSTIKFEFKSAWMNKVLLLRNKHNIFEEKRDRVSNKINSFDFIETLSDAISNEIIVTDMGTSFTCTMQSLKMNGRARLFTSSGCCSMGFGLPGAIGACLASNRNVLCICGDGGIQMTISELQTIKHNNLPVKIFILNNKGYSAISLMQDNLFGGNYVGSTSKSGVSCPDFVNVAQAYGIKSCKFSNVESFKISLPAILKQDGPSLIELEIIENQPLFPRVQSSKDESGKIKSGILENMFPFLPQSEIDFCLN